MSDVQLSLVEDCPEFFKSLKGKTLVVRYINKDMSTSENVEIIVLSDVKIHTIGKHALIFEDANNPEAYTLIWPWWLQSIVVV